MSDSGDDFLSTAIVEVGPQQESERREACLVVISGSRLGQVIKIASKPMIVGRGRDADVTLLDHGISRHHARFERRTSGAVAVVDLGSTNGTYHNGEPVGDAILADGDRVRLGVTVLKFAWQDPVEASFHQTQFDAARRDGLTGCYNKRHLLEHLSIELSFARRHRRPVSVAMIDIDHFKRVNDTWGHMAGDTVLKALVGVLAQGIRAEDVLARYGGEEFVVVMRETEPSQAVIVAERLRQCVEEAVFHHGQTKIPVTISVGVACGPTKETSTPDALLGVADEHLYEAKNDGRNMVAAPLTPVEIEPES